MHFISSQALMLAAVPEKHCGPTSYHQVRSLNIAMQSGFIPLERVQRAACQFQSVVWSMAHVHNCTSFPLSGNWHEHLDVWQDSLPYFGHISKEW